MRTVGYVVVATLGTAAIFAAVAVVLYFGGIVGNDVSASYSKKTAHAKVEQRVFSEGNARGSYEFFFQTCNDVLAENLQIGAAEERVAEIRAEPDDAYGTKAGKVADAISDLTGLRQLRAQTAADYDAAASEYTHNPFLAASLPTTIQPPYDVTCS